MSEEKEKDAPYLVNGMTFGQRVQDVVSQMSVPKDRRNDFGGYNFRNAEMIYQAAKPHLNRNVLFLAVEDTIEVVQSEDKQKFFCKAAAYLVDLDSGLQTPIVYGWAELQDSKKGMDQGQLTGATSSYARKYAMSALFGIDENKDLDHPDLHVNNPAQRMEPVQQQQRQQQRQPEPWPDLAELDYGGQCLEIKTRCTQFKDHKWKNLDQLANGYKKLVTYIKTAPATVQEIFLGPLEKVKDTIKARLSANKEG